MDDEKHGCRYLIAGCEELEPVNKNKQPDAEAWEWAAPFRKSTDKDPIVRFRWSQVTIVLQQKTKVPPRRVVLLERALRVKEESRVERLAGGAGGSSSAGHDADGSSPRQGASTGGEDNTGPEKKGTKESPTSN